MDPSFQNSGGLWNTPRAQFSKEAQEMLQTVREESKLTCLQRQRMGKHTKNGAVLPQKSDPGKSLQKFPEFRPGRRSVHSCQSGNNYKREKFQPAPSTRDLEKEKKLLQEIMDTGKKDPTAGSAQETAARSQPDEPEIDLHQQILNEIEERRQFLANMAALGQEKEHIGIISFEISQRLHELKLLDQKKKGNDREALPVKRDV